MELKKTYLSRLLESSRARFFREGRSVTLPDHIREKTRGDLRAYHLAVSKSGDLISHYSDREKFMRGIRTPIKPGRWLAKVIHGSTARDCEAFAAWFSTEYVSQLHFTTDASQIVDVYDNSPFGSCMQRSHGSIRTSLHPCIVYADNSKISLAYLTNGNGEYVARCLVNTSTMAASKIYGDNPKMLQALNAANYSQGNGALSGCAIKKIDIGGDRWLMPYIDAHYRGSGAASVEECGDEFRICEPGDGEYYVGETCGYIEQTSSLASCDRCGAYIRDSEDAYTTYEDDTVCLACIDDHYTYASTGRFESDYVRNDSVIYCESDDEFYSDDYASAALGRCASTGNYYLLEELVVCDIGRYEGEYIHTERAYRDAVTKEWFYDDEEASDEYLGKCIHDSYAVTTTTGGIAHIDTCFQHISGDFITFVHPDDIDEYINDVIVIHDEREFDVYKPKHVDSNLTAEDLRLLISDALAIPEEA
jgi:hypothetical protein